VTAESLRQAVANGNSELVRDVWNRLRDDERKAGLVSFAEVAADFQRRSC
jgi:hypothetical protein